eukprot:TRINITY_DN3438_c0_g1_i3.p3 TRINITY_DN3438_c0_g1~~TRINITY_DN3438_c0_g1_i3.p3  ORF type:complete len:239 (+),score=38.20 TRINITY_DN3438_c0_g1_i3:922-1638(+)
MQDTNLQALELIFLILNFSHQNVEKSLIVMVPSFKKDVSKIKIMVSGNIDENTLKRLAVNKTNKLNSIDILAIEDEIVVCNSQPHLSMYYKIVQLENTGILTFSESKFKTILPGNKVVYRIIGNSLNKYFVADIIALPEENLYNLSEIKVVTITENLQRYIIIPQKVIKLTNQINVFDKSLDDEFSLEHSRQYYNLQILQLSPKTINQNEKYLIVTTEKYWEYYQRASQQVIIPKTIY